MDLNSDDLPYYVAYVLLDEARRIPSGKRQTAPLKGLWMALPGRSGMRLHDRRFRWAVCIEALRTVGGLSVDKAAAEIAAVLGRGNAKQVNVIRVAYYEWRRRHVARWDQFFLAFLHWRKWALESDEETIQVALRICPPHMGNFARCELASLVDRLRKDPRQKLRNRSWLLEAGELQRNRIESNHWDPEKEWQPLATDLWTLGRVHAGVDDLGEAQNLLSRALAIWQNRGHRIAESQQEAIRMLEAELEELKSAASPSTNTR